MKKVNFSKLQNFDDCKIEMKKVIGGVDSCYTGKAVYANGSVHNEYCIAYPNGGWDIVFD